MENNYKKELAYIANLLLKVIYNEDITFNETQSLENIISDLDYNELDEEEFRW